MKLSEHEKDLWEVVAWITLLSCALLAWNSYGAPPADAPVAVNVAHARLVAVDGGVLEVDGGAWFSDDVVLARAKELEQARARPAGGVEVSVALIVTTALVSAGAGAAVACVATTGDALCRKQP